MPFQFRLLCHSTDFLKRVLIAADDAVKSELELYLTSTKMGSSEVDRKFKVAADLLCDFVKDFPTLNPNIRNVRFTAPRIFDRKRRKSMDVFKILGHLGESIDQEVEFPYDSSSLNAYKS